MKLKDKSWRKGMKLLQTFAQTLCSLSNILYVMIYRRQYHVLDLMCKKSSFLRLYALVIHFYAAECQHMITSCKFTYTKVRHYSLELLTDVLLWYTHSVKISVLQQSNQNKSSQTHSRRWSTLELETIIVFINETSALWHWQPMWYTSYVWSGYALLGTCTKRTRNQRSSWQTIY